MYVSTIILSCNIRHKITGSDSFYPKLILQTLQNFLIFEVKSN